MNLISLCYSLNTDHRKPATLSPSAGEENMGLRKKKDKSQFGDARDRLAEELDGLMNVPIDAVGFGAICNQRHFGSDH